MGIEDLGLSVRAYYSLKRGGIHTIGQLREASDDELLAIRDFGLKCLREVREKVEELDARKVAEGDVRELVEDALSTILGWAWALNEVAGHDKYDTATPPMRTFYELLARARELGVAE